MVPPCVWKWGWSSSTLAASLPVGDSLRTDSFTAECRP